MWVLVFAQWLVQEENDARLCPVASKKDGPVWPYTLGQTFSACGVGLKNDTPDV